METFDRWTKLRTPYSGASRTVHLDRITIELCSGVSRSLLDVLGGLIILSFLIFWFLLISPRVLDYLNWIRRPRLKGRERRRGLGEIHSEIRLHPLGTRWAGHFSWQRCIRTGRKINARKDCIAIHSNIIGRVIWGLHHYLSNKIWPLDAISYVGVRGVSGGRVFGTREEIVGRILCNGGAPGRSEKKHLGIETK